MRRRVVLLHFGLPGAAGSAPRRRMWRETVEHLGGEYVEISLLRASPHLPDIVSVLRGRAAPETLAWSPRGVLRKLRKQEPDVIVCETARTFHPAFLNAVPHVVLDFVDRLSASYTDRASLGSPLDRLMYRLLAHRHRAFEAQEWDVRRVAAGRSDAESLGAFWLPNLAPAASVAAESEEKESEEKESEEKVAPEVDLLFFGSLSYPPNVAACARLARLWPRLQLRRPGTTLKIAGRRPSSEVTRWIHQNGWTLEENFADLSSLCASAHLAVVPLEHAAGIQNKVLEAAAHGLPQVVSQAATAGFEVSHPLCVAASDEEFIEQIVELLDSETKRAELAERARQWASSKYVVEALSTQAREVLLKEIKNP